MTTNALRAINLLRVAIIITSLSLSAAHSATSRSAFPASSATASSTAITAISTAAIVIIVAIIVVIVADDGLAARAAHDAFVKKWATLCPAVAKSLQEAGLELVAFYEFPKATWKSIRTTNTIENLNREFRHPTKTQASFSAEAAALTVLYGLVALGPIHLRRIDGHTKLPHSSRRSGRKSRKDVVVNRQQPVTPSGNFHKTRDRSPQPSAKVHRVKENPHFGQLLQLNALVSNLSKLSVLAEYQSNGSAQDGHRTDHSNQAKKAGVISRPASRNTAGISVFSAATIKAIPRNIPTVATTIFQSCLVAPIKEASNIGVPTIAIGCCHRRRSPVPLRSDWAPVEDCLDIAGRTGTQDLWGSIRAKMLRPVPSIHATLAVQTKAKTGRARGRPPRRPCRRPAVSGPVAA
jgi:hypothetical protein